jgi:hypothetical protein
MASERLDMAMKNFQHMNKWWNATLASVGPT